MKQILLIPIALCFLMVTSFAQQNKAERIEAMKVAFITTKLELTPEESQRFWPVYNQYRDELKDLREGYKPPQSIQIMSDAEVEEYLDNSLKIEEQEMTLKRDYIEQLRKVLPIRKIVMLKRVEDEFKLRLLGERYKQQNQRQQQRNKMGSKN